MKHEKDTAEHLLRWLNNDAPTGKGWGEYAGSNDEQSRKRVVRIIAELQEAEGLISQALEDGEKENTYETPAALAASLGVVNRLLKRYSLKWLVTLDPEQPFADYMLMETHAGEKFPYGEILAVNEIRELLNADLLWKVGECSCGRYFFRFREDQHACSTACRMRAYESTPEAKAKRKTYMREYHKLRKTRSVK